jgi:hypothetical protein
MTASVMLCFLDHSHADFMQWFAKGELQTIASTLTLNHDIPDTGANQERVNEDERSAVLWIDGSFGGGAGELPGLRADQ